MKVHLLSRLRTAWQLVQQAASAWLLHNASSMGAAIAFYTVFSIAPILIIVMSLLGLLLGTETVRTELLDQLQALMGEAGASAVRTLLSNTTYLGKSGLATAVGVVTLLIGASSVFVQLQQSLDQVWGVPAQNNSSSVWQFLRTRLLSFGLVLGMGFLLLVSLVVSAALAAFGSYLQRLFGDDTYIVYCVDVLLSVGMSTLVFALVYKALPRQPIAWTDVWIGGLVTAVLFAVGKIAIGIYLGKSAFTSAYGAAGSFVVLLLWVYYSAQIFLFGAEFTRAFAYAHGTRAAAPARSAA